MDYQGYEGLRIELDDQGVALVTLDRPERLNAFDGAMRYSIRRMIDEVGSDPDARVMVMTGEGRGFCSGADLTAEDRRPWPTGPAEPRFGWCVDLLEMPKPTIAAVNGVAAGGGLGLALLCDIRLVSSAARLIPIWMKRAIHPDDLITWTLPRLVGHSKALQWLYAAEDIPLDQAMNSGLVSEVLKSDDLMPRVMAMAAGFASGPPKHLALTKQAVLQGLTKTPWDAAMIESWSQDQALASADFQEGLAAFKEKRAPKFTGK